tara:strand:+ start:274 stop:1290 length:1017 start_codon:yes stop_codon:yes gene_type:complete
MPDTIAVAVLNWNGQSLLERYLPKLVADSKGLGKVYLIDNASTDNSISWTQEKLPEVEIIKLDDNYGYAGGYNKAIAQLEEELVVLINSDIESTPNWLQPIAARFAAEPKLGALQPKILDLKDRSKFEYAGASGGYMDRLGYAFCRGRLFDDLERDEGQYNDYQECFWATGACLAVRKSAYNEVRGLYATLFAHMEEIDLCWKMQINGWKIAVEPASEVYHLGGATLEAASPKKTYLNFRNNLIILFLNLPHLESMRIIFSRLLLDGLAGLRLLMQGKLSHVWAIVRAHFAFYGMFTELYRERVKRKQEPFKNMKGLYSKSIIWAYFAQKKRKFSDLF